MKVATRETAIDNEIRLVNEFKDLPPVPLMVAARRMAVELDELVAAARQRRQRGLPA